MQTYQNKRKAPERACFACPEDSAHPERNAPSGRGRRAQPMSPQLREKFEPGFCADFTNIRISRGHIPEEMGVQAVAQGTDILLDESAGMDVLGHELAHVVQQAQGRVEGGFPVVENAALEQEADVMGAACGLRAHRPGRAPERLGRGNHGHRPYVRSLRPCPVQEPAGEKKGQESRSATTAAVARLPRQFFRGCVRAPAPGAHSTG